jgi:hypothetical protein
MAVKYLRLTQTRQLGAYKLVARMGKVKSARKTEIEKLTPEAAYWKTVNA